MDDKAVFTIHIDSRGRLKEAKEMFECVHCGGESYEVSSSVIPGGVQHFTFSCTDCHKIWDESY